MDVVGQWWGDFRRFSKPTALAVALVFAASVCVILFYPRQYESRAKLLLRVGHESGSLDPTADATGQIVQMQTSRDHDVFTELEVMRSRVLFSAVVDTVGLDVILSGLPDDAKDGNSTLSTRLLAPVKNMIASLDPVSDRELAIRALEDSFSFSCRTNSSLIDIDYRAKSPEVAQAITQAWVDAYLEHHNDFHRTEGSVEFFQMKEAEIRERLNEEHAKLREAKNSYRLVTIPGQQKLLEGQLSVVRSSLIETSALLAASRSRIKSLNELVAVTDDRLVTDEVSGKTNEARDVMRGRLFDLEVLEREYSAKYKSDHPRLETIRRQLSESRRIVDDQDDGRAEITSGINPIHLQLTQEKLLEVALYESLNDKQEALLKNQVELRVEVAQLNDTEEKISAIERQVSILEARYLAHSERMEQSRIDESLRDKQISSVNQVQPASFEQIPVSPKKKVVALLGCVAAMSTFIGLPLLMGVLIKLPETQQITPIEESRDVSDTKQDRPLSSEPSPEHSDDKLLHPMFVHNDAARARSEEKELGSPGTIVGKAH